ncbi:hypothetical protein ACJIZ3_003534 [Penstemon smallii]|uniref:Uncharacterized protein n=1 Tax=Penstemon smallii TaxID=265156 RepID=A0ABD3UB38_9LAMI
MNTETDSDDSPTVSSSSTDYIEITGDDEIDRVRVNSVLFGNSGADVEIGEFDESENFEGGEVEIGQDDGVKSKKLGLLIGIKQ